MYIEIIMVKISRVISLKEEEGKKRLVEEGGREDGKKRKFWGGGFRPGRCPVN